MQVNADPFGRGTDQLLKNLNLQLSTIGGFWKHQLEEVSNKYSPIGLHLAIFSEPFLTCVIEGRKTVESRLSRNRISPYGSIYSGDIILIKEVGGPICGITLAKEALFYDLNVDSLSDILDEYGSRICAPPDYWDSISDVEYATLIELEQTSQVSPIPFSKRDRRGWVTLRSRQSLIFE